MKYVKIIGIGVLCRAGTTAEEVWDSLDEEKGLSLKNGCIEYGSLLPPAKRRRINRYSDMAVYCSGKALDDGAVKITEIDSYHIGTIFTTGYGPMVSNLQFAASVVDGNPDLCSPTVFANTVSNVCVGQVCMAFDCKGVSTVVMGSNNLGYSQMLLNKGDADYILAGAVEEYCTELYESFRQNEHSLNVSVQEGAVTFLLEREGKSEGYCELVDFYECSIGEYPLVNKTNESAKGRMIKLLNDIANRNKEEFDVIFTSYNGSEFDTVEREVIEEVFKDTKMVVGSVKEYLGETLGAAFNMNIMIAALSLKRGRLPKALSNSLEKEIKKVLVTGYDVTGNYIAYVLEKEGMYI